jgi:hypothetical protein
MTPHNCRCESCRPFNYLELVHEWLAENVAGFSDGPGCDYRPACGNCQREWDYWAADQVEAVASYGFPCVMSGEVMPESHDR